MTPTNRRTCLKAFGLAGGAVMAGWRSRETVLNAWLGEPAVELRPRLGLQLFTVRGLLRTDPEGTLTAVAKIGFTEVEMFGFGGNAFVEDPLFGLAPRRLREVLHDRGLSVPSAQISGRLDEIGSIADTVNELGIRHLIVGMPSEFLTITVNGPVVSGVKDADQVKTLAERLNRFATTCRANGLGFGYHNHHMEFVRLGAARAYDVLLEHIDPDLVRMELDVGWVKAGGADPVDYLVRYPGRFVACHLKDFDPRRAMPTDRSRAPIPEMARMVAPGDGTVDFAGVLREMARQKIEHGYVECDLPDDPLETARRGFEYLRRLTDSVSHGVLALGR